jgi:transcriptional regulator of acetoin/glycerol metabolism
MIGAEELSFLEGANEPCHLGPMSLREMEIAHIQAALDTCAWNVSRAARQLGIDRATLTRKMKRYRLKRP